MALVSIPPIGIAPWLETAVSMVATDQDSGPEFHEKLIRKVSQQEVERSKGSHAPPYSETAIWLDAILRSRRPVQTSRTEAHRPAAEPVSSLTESTTTAFEPNAGKCQIWYGLSASAPARTETDFRIYSTGRSPAGSPDGPRSTETLTPECHEAETPSQHQVAAHRHLPGCSYRGRARRLIRARKRTKTVFERMEPPGSLRLVPMGTWPARWSPSVLRGEGRCAGTRLDSPGFHSDVDLERGLGPETPPSGRKLLGNETTAHQSTTYIQYHGANISPSRPYDPLTPQPLSAPGDLSTATTMVDSDSHTLPKESFAPVPVSIWQTLNCWSKPTACSVYCMAYVVNGLLSLSLSLWWTIDKKDLAAGFTLGAYIVAIGSAIIMPLQLRHGRRCRCDNDPHAVKT